MIQTTLLPLLLIQLLGTTDFMLVMPLGPSLAEGFGIPVEKTAWLSGAFALCAAISGLVLMRYLDGFTRKTLLCSLLLINSSLFFISAMLEAFPVWVVLRGCIGFISTPIAALSMAIAMDMSEHNRPKAMATMSLGFSLSAVIGVPLGLWLAALTNWHMVYWVEGILACALALYIYLRLPNTPNNSNQNSNPLTFKQVYQSDVLKNGLILLCVSLFAAFLIIPHLAAILQYNFHVPFSDLGNYYAVGGIATMFLTLGTGRLYQYLSPRTLLIISSALSLVFLWTGFVFYWLAPFVIFVAFMSLNGSRNLVVQTYLSHLPDQNQRAGYMGLLATLRNVSTAFAAFVSSLILQSQEDGPLLNVSLLIILGSAFIVLTPFLLNSKPLSPSAS